ncbi:hypothetical protein CLAVI_000495 [Candidatus Clavichlamydia salmonicola]|uniref:hypothetical protein n=1 Tax=Candidatus Clavichlamydia salmonicola TaxID=469812 RepID=UPI0018916D8E|nr:hypothetical protein [Candidatus Clavichlamydia salmonicola]MBF5050873.1 hypothetical protein [Candidatus Clavichlamydia salmonicola]
MLQINHILNYVGLSTPSSLREAVHNIKQNTAKLIEITVAIIVGTLGIYADRLCNHCLLCLPKSAKNSSISYNDHRTKCVPGIGISTTVCMLIVYTLNQNSCFSLLKHARRKNFKKTCYAFSKSIFLVTIVTINSSIAIACLGQNKLPTDISTTACSLTGLMSALFGSGLILFFCNDLLSVLLPINLPVFQEPIEMTLLNPLEEEIDHPLQPITTELLDLLGQVDQIFSHLLDHAIEHFPMIEDDVQSMLNKALLLLQKIDSIFLRKLSHYGPSFLLAINELFLILKNIIGPLQLEHNITSISTILGKLHTLIRDLVALHPIEVPTEIRLALPSFQALCPPPEYTEEQTSSMNTSTVLTLPSLHLVSPPSYEEHSETATTSF